MLLSKHLKSAGNSWDLRSAVMDRELMHAISNSAQQHFVTFL
jgi:hypothetical protein